MSKGPRRWPLWGAMVLGVLFLLPSAAFGQGCALCYTQAASSGARMIQALKEGILILVIPPMFLSVGFTALAYHKRNKFRTTVELHDDYESLRNKSTRADGLLGKDLRKLTRGAI